jgi:hypothetical protein
MENVPTSFHSIAQEGRTFVGHQIYELQALLEGVVPTRHHHPQKFPILHRRAYLCNEEGFYILRAIVVEY